MKIEEKHTLSTFAFSTLQAALQNPDAYKTWLGEHKTVSGGIAAFALTLETLLENWSEWQDHYQVERLLPLIINGIHWTNENFSQLTYGHFTQ